MASSVVSASSASSAVPASLLFSEQAELLQRIGRAFGRSIADFSECFAAVQEKKFKEWRVVEACSDDLKKVVDATGRSLLMQAVAGNDPELVSDLVKMRVDQADQSGNTPLHEAAKMGRVDLIPTLAGTFGIDQSNDQGETPLHIAIREGQLEATRALSANGAKTSITYKGDNLFPLAYAVVLGEIDIARLLLSRGARFQDTTFAKNRTLLHLAVHYRQNESLRLLFRESPEQCQALLERRDEEGDTPVSLAAYTGNVQAITFLRLQGAKLDSKDGKDRTPVHRAAEGNQINVLKLLADYECKMEETDGEGRTPAQLATERSTKNFLKNLADQRHLMDKSQPHYGYRPPRNLVFKGGGPKGLAYLGVLQELSERRAFGLDNEGTILESIERVAGSSSGAITSALIAVGLSLDRIQALMEGMNLDDFLDLPGAATFSTPWGVIQGAAKQIAKTVVDPSHLFAPFQAIYTCTGICRGEKFRRWIEGEIAAATGIDECTFGELRKLVRQGGSYKHLCVFATDIRANAPSPIRRFSSEDPHCDTVVISSAIRASMSIPVIFEPYKVQRKAEGATYTDENMGPFVDGGVLYNLPIEAFDDPKEGTKNWRTLGFNLYSPDEGHLPAKQPNTLPDLLKCLFSLFNNAEDHIRSRGGSKDGRIVNISNEGVKLLDRKLTPDQRKNLINSGRKGVREFLSAYRLDKGQISLATSPGLRMGSFMTLREPPRPFIGREGTLIEIEEGLDKHRIHCLHGISGIGKMALARTFAERFLGRYSFVGHIDCRTEDAMDKSYRALADLLGIENSGPEFRAKVHRKLAQDRVIPCLLVYEGLMDPNFDFPQKGCHVLITSHRKIGPSHSEILPFSKEEVDDFLQKKQANNLSEESIAKCAGHPGELQNLVRDFQRADPGKKIQEAIQRQLGYLTPETREWLRICSHLDSVVPEAYLQEWLTMTYGSEGKAVPTTMILEEVVNYGMQSRKEKELTMKPFLQEGIRSISDDLFPKVVDLLTGLADKWARDGAAFGSKEMMEGVAVWGPHAIRVINDSKFAQEKFRNAALRFYRLLASWKDEQGLFKEAITYYAKLCEIRKVLRKDDSAALAIALSLKGSAHAKNGEYKAAGDAQNEALDTLMVALRNDTLRRAINSLQEAQTEEACTLALSGIDNKALSKEEKNILLLIGGVMNNKAIDIGREGKESSAFVFYLRSYVIRKRLLDLNNKSVITSLNNLGDCKEKQKKFKEALVYYQRALAACGVFLEEEINPEQEVYHKELIAIILKGIADSSHKEPTQAKKCYELAITIRRIVCGQENESMVRYLEAAGDFYATQGKAEKARAKELYEEARNTAEKIFPKDDPRTLALLKKAPHPSPTT